MDRNLKQKAVGKRLQEIQNAYMALWKQFSEAAATQQLSAKATNDTYGALLKLGTPTTAEALFVLPSWPYKARSDKRVDIVVRVVEQMDEDLSVVTKCTTQIGYFAKPEASKEHRSLLEMHYDFETPVSEAHPVFHAQIGQTKWPLEKLSELGLTLQRTSVTESEAGLYGSARIPTAFIGFSQILTVLAADHLQPKAYRQVIDEVRATHSALPAVKCDDFGREVESKKFPVAHHWYEHRYEASVVQVSRKGKWKASIPLLRLEADGTTASAAENALLTLSKLRRDQVRFVAASDVLPENLGLIRLRRHLSRGGYGVGDDRRDEAKDAGAAQLHG